MTQYNLTHLIHHNQNISGPIQDDEALFLYALVKATRIRYIVEIGGLNGYSASNFLAAIEHDGKVITIEPNELKPINSNHIIINKKAHEILIEDLNLSKIDLIFFDAHDLNSQILFYNYALEEKLIDNTTIIVLHDTHTHPIQTINNQRYLTNNIGYGNNGYVHQSVERLMVNCFIDLGYHALHLHIDNNRLPLNDISFRHGLTILTKPYKLL